MVTTMSKAQFLAELNDENASWQALLDDIGETNMTQPEVAGGWSIKDIVAHITEWRRRTVKRFQAKLNHTTEITLPPWPSELREDDEINAWIYESHRDRPLADVLGDSRDVFQQLVNTFDAFSDDAFQEFQRTEWPWEEPLSGRFVFSHFHEEHEPDMRAWLDKVKKGSS